MFFQAVPKPGAARIVSYPNAPDPMVVPREAPKLFQAGSLDTAHLESLICRVSRDKPILSSVTLIAYFDFALRVVRARESNHFKSFSHCALAPRGPRR